MTFCMLLVTLFIPSQAPQPDPNVALELGKLKGVWRVVTMSQDGGDRTEAFKNVRIQFNDNVMSMTDADGKPLKRPDGKAEQMTFTLDLAATPRAVDFMISEKFKSLGIYELSGDDLKLCMVEPGAVRPTEFKATRGGTSIVLKRVVK